MALALLTLMSSSNFVGLLDGEIGGFRSSQNLVHVSGGAAEKIQIVDPVGHEAACPDVIRQWVHRWKAILCGEIDELIAVRKQCWLPGNTSNASARSLVIVPKTLSRSTEPRASNN
jgi:hypothetical protein